MRPCSMEQRKMHLHRFLEVSAAHFGLTPKPGVIQGASAERPGIAVEDRAEQDDCCCEAA